MSIITYDMNQRTASVLADLNNNLDKLIAIYAEGNYDAISCPGQVSWFVSTLAKEYLKLDKRIDDFFFFALDNVPQEKKAISERFVDLLKNAAIDNLEMSDLERKYFRRADRFKVIEYFCISARHLCHAKEFVNERADLLRFLDEWETALAYFGLIFRFNFGDKEEFKPAIKKAFPDGD